MSRKLKQVISCQSFSPISDVRDGIIVTKDGKFVKLMEFSPINYGLRSNEDKNMITAQYAAAIRSFPSVVQIKVLSNRANVEHYISGMVESVRHEKNEGTRELMREQIDMMSEFGTSQGVSRRFFLAFQYEEEEGFAHRSPSWNEIRSTITRQEDAIRSNLRACGNIMISRPHDDVYVLSTLYDIMSRAQSANHPFDERMADVVARYTAANIDFTRDSAAHLPVNDVLAPYCIDTESSPRYIIVDGIYYMCCYLPSNAYPVRVLGGWMQLLAGLGEGIDVDVWLQKISPEKIQTALHHGLRFNAMRFRNTETTSSDYDDVKAAVDAGYYLKSSLAAGDEFAYMSTMLTITGESEREIDYKFKEIRRIFIERESALKRFFSFFAQSLHESLMLLDNEIPPFPSQSINYIFVFPCSENIVVDCDNFDTKAITDTICLHTFCDDSAEKTSFHMTGFRSNDVPRGTYICVCPDKFSAANPHEIIQIFHQNFADSPAKKG